MQPPRALRSALLLVSATGLLAGCAGPATKATVGVSASEYEQVYVTGSYIPVLVPKGSGLRPIHTISPAVIILQDDVQRALGNGPINMH